jgi:hypothetical protein
MYYIYKVTHVPSGRYYIGQRKVPARYTDPARDSRYRGSGSVWQHILHAHQPDEFVKQVLVLAYTGYTANLAEEYLVADKYRTDPLCMNMRAGGGVAGVSDDVRRRTADKLRGRVVSQATRDKLSLALKGGKNPNAVDAAKRMSLLNVGKKQSEAHRKARSEALLGVPKSATHRAALSAANKGKPRTQEQIEAAAAGHRALGRKMVHTEETRRKMSESAKLRCLRNGLKLRDKSEVADA